MSSNNTDQFDERGDRHGHTLGLNSSGDLRINALKQPDPIYDLDAVVQDLKVALKTPRGEDPFRPDYGIDLLSAVGGNNARLRSSIVQTIGPDADPRVESIDEIEIERPEGDREETYVTVHLTLTEGPSIAFDFSPRVGRSAARGGE